MHKTILAIVMAILTTPALAQDVADLAAQGVAGGEPILAETVGITDSEPAEEEATEVVFDPNAAVLDLLEQAAETCIAEVDAESSLLEEGEEVNIEALAACQAHASMKDAYWQMQVTLAGRYLQMAEAGAEGELAYRVADRDRALINAAKIANDLAAIEADGDLAAAEADNALAAEKAVGELAAAVAGNDLKAEEAREIGPEPAANPLAFLSEEEPVTMESLDESLDMIADELQFSNMVQRNICASNPGVSWCP